MTATQAETTTALNIDELMELTDEEWGTGPVFSSGSFATTVLTMEDRVHRGVMLEDQYGIFGWETGSFQRLLQDGPMVEGPQAFMNKKGVSLTVHRQAPVREITPALPVPDRADQRTPGGNPRVHLKPGTARGRTAR